MSTHAGKRRPRRQRGRDPTSGFESLLQHTVGHERYVLKLYVTGTTRRSAQAIANIRALCDERLSGRYELEVVDLYQAPQVAVDQQIVAAPTLVKQLPEPVRRLVGDLSDRTKVLLALNLPGSDPATPGQTQWLEI
jgi:circadian clock protein KaiB